MAARLGGFESFNMWSTFALKKRYHQKWQVDGLHFSWQYFWNWVSFVLKPFSQTCDSIELEPWGTLRAVRAHGEPWGTVCMLETVRVERTHVEPWGTVCIWGTVRVERTHVEPWGTVCMWGTVRVERTHVEPWETLSWELELTHNQPFNPKSYSMEKHCSGLEDIRNNVFRYSRVAHNFKTMSILSEFHSMSLLSKSLTVDSCTVARLAMYLIMITRLV
jgi:hypothetical protein